MWSASCVPEQQSSSNGTSLYPSGTCMYPSGTCMYPSGTCLFGLWYVHVWPVPLWYVHVWPLVRACLAVTPLVRTCYPSGTYVHVYPSGTYMFGLYPSILSHFHTFSSFSKIHSGSEAAAAGVNRGIQFVAQRYCVECKGIYQELSKIIQVWSHLPMYGPICPCMERGLMSHLPMYREGFDCRGEVPSACVWGGV